ncbi:MAG TPA: GntR family transcriptional regulator [Anaerolineales bacterium]|nr:GntR family transcriptional regulator [Anaerolineales bacterium]
METVDKSSSRESDRVEKHLRQLILSLQIEPGLAISESTLIKRYGWGRTPLREAFQRLAEQSLLQIIPRHGVVVTPLSVFEFVEVMDAMAMVIGPAAWLACQHLTGDELAQLEQTIEKGKLAAINADFLEVATQDYEFHRLLAVATHNRYLSRYLLHLHQVATRFNLASWNRDGNVEFSMSEHRKIVTTLQQHDEVGARTMMLEHIENARHRVMGTFQP